MSLGKWGISYLSGLRIKTEKRYEEERERERKACVKMCAEERESFP